MQPKSGNMLCMHNCPPDRSASSLLEPAADALCLSFWLSQYVGQVWNESNAEDEVLVMVVRTGLCTTMGNMLRQVTNPLHNTQLYKDPFLRVSQLLWHQIFGHWDPGTALHPRDSLASQGQPCIFTQHD